jgi:hypothetical protein
MTDFTIAAKQLAEQAIDLQKRIDAKRAEYDAVTTQLTTEKAALAAVKAQIRELRDALGYGAKP